MSDLRLARVLEGCLRSLYRGRSVEETLRPHPKLRPELDSLVAVGVQLRGAPAVELPVTARVSIRSELLDTIRREGRPAEARRPLLLLPPFRLHRRIVFAPAIALALVVVLALAAATLLPAGETRAATVLTVLQGDVQVETARGIVTAHDGLKLKAGDRIVTGPGARAVLTFFDGSTVTVDSDSTVVLRSVSERDGHLSAELTQQRGSTWTYIPEGLGRADVQIDTPSARVQTQQSSVETTVRSDGQTDVGASSGAIQVQSQGTQAEVPAGSKASVEAPGVVSQQPAASPASELVFRVEGRALVYVTDPRSATVGTISPGVPINQVPGARTVQDGAATVVYLPNPTDGVYRVGVSNAGEGQVAVTSYVSNGSGTPVETSVAVKAGESVSLDIGLTAGDLKLLSTNRNVDAVPRQVVVPDRAVDKANAVATQVSTPATKPTERPSATATPTLTPKATNTSTATPPPPTATPVPPTSTPKPVLTARPSVSDKEQNLSTDAQQAPSTTR